MKRILTGDRTTGKLHLGHYVGSLQNRVKLQETYDTFIILADIQALTTHFESPEKVRQGIYDVAIDNLAAGLDPEKATLFQQSRVGAIAELTIFYSMLVTVNVLRHNPTIKTEAKQYGYDDLTYGFLGYPVSQTADITFCGADLVPVGEDQLPHIELTRKIVRRFNQLYGEQAGLVEPSPLLSETSRLVGLDGNSKMGKSLGNAIYLSDDADEVKAKVRAAVTDPARIMLKDIGHPEICTVARYHEVFNKGESEDIASRCRKAEIGCAACKNRLAEVLNQVLEPIRDRRAFYEARPEHVREIIETGTERAEKIGNETVRRVRDAMHLSL